MFKRACSSRLKGVSSRSRLCENSKDERRSKIERAISQGSIARNGGERDLCGRRPAAAEAAAGFAPRMSPADLSLRRRPTLVSPQRRNFITRHPSGLLTGLGEKHQYCTEDFVRSDSGYAGEVLAAFLRVVMDRAAGAGNTATYDAAVLLPPLVPVEARAMNADHWDTTKRSKMLWTGVVAHKHGREGV